MRSLKKILWNIAFNMGALYVAVELLEKVNYTGGWVFFLITGTLIGFLNFFLKPILKFIAIPLIFFSAGLFLVLINAGIVWIADNLLEVFDFTNIDLQVEGTLSYVYLALIFGLTNWFEHWAFKRVR